MFCENPLKKDTKTKKQKHEKSDFVQSTTYNKLCKKSKIIDIFKKCL